jgi:hypothetical protein
MTFICHKSWLALFLSLSLSLSLSSEEARRDEGEEVQQQQSSLLLDICAVAKIYCEKPFANYTQMDCNV